MIARFYCFSLHGTGTMLYKVLMRLIVYLASKIGRSSIKTTCQPWKTSTFLEWNFLGNVFLRLILFAMHINHTLCNWWISHSQSTIETADWTETPWPASFLRGNRAVSTIVQIWPGCVLQAKDLRLFSLSSVIFLRFSNKKWMTISISILIGEPRK